MQGLSVKDMEELRDDIKMYLDSDRATPTRVQYWEVFSSTRLKFRHSRWFIGLKRLCMCGILIPYMDPHVDSF